MLMRDKMQNAYYTSRSKIYAEKNSTTYRDGNQQVAVAKPLYGIQDGILHSLTRLQYGQLVIQLIKLQNYQHFSKMVKWEDNFFPIRE